MTLSACPSNSARRPTGVAVVALLMTWAAVTPLSQAPPPAPATQWLPAGQTNDPFPDPLPAVEGAIRVNVAEFASLPDIDGVASRMMNLVHEPGTRRLFVNDMRGPIYSISYDGRTVTPYLDVNQPQWGHPVQSTGRERGFQSFTMHPQFGEIGTPGYGKFYTFLDTTNMAPPPDFVPGGEESTHHTVLLEWTARSPADATYDGGPPKELFRLRQPFANHNGGHLAFHPHARPGTPEFGLLYVAIADGGSGGDPFAHAQNLGSAFGKLFRIDPLGSNSRNKQYGVPASNPFMLTGGALPEIYAYGVRNAQRFVWDPKNNNLFLADIGQNIIEKVTLVPPGANLGWNVWEGSFRFISRQAVAIEGQRGDPKVTYPLVEYGQPDPLLQSQAAANGVIVYRGSDIPQIGNLVLFTDMPSGEIFFFSADDLPRGGQEPIRRIILRTNGADTTLLRLVQEKNTAQGKAPASRADLRLSQGVGDQVLLLNKGDGTIRQLTR
jgi:hypothetical protein